MSYSLDGYVDVAERIRQLREKYPQAVLRPWNPDEPFRLQEIGDRLFIIYTAACYRTPDDPMPAVAVAAEPAIGKTNYTRDSEVMNAETSAWGRCIVAALAADTQKVASADEVRNRRADQDGGNVQRPAVPVAARPAVPVAARPATKPQQSSAPSGAVTITDAQRKTIGNLMKQKELTDADLPQLCGLAFGTEVASIDGLSKRDASALISLLINGTVRT